MIKIGFIGAGGVNFGSAEGPWDHASRLELLGGVKVVGIADPDTKKAESVLQQRLNGKYGEMYEGASIRSSFQDLINLDKPDAVFIGLPPHCHGLSEAPYNVECVCADAGVHMFIEKPVSSYEPARLKETMQKISEARKRGVITSVGYMFRYSRSVEKMKEIIQQDAERKGLPKGTNHVTAVLAKYNCAYSLIDKKFWWDMRSSGGPIVEQCTHFADLVRHITDSECDESTLTALGVHSDTPVIGSLSDMSVSGGEGTELIEESIPLEHRVPRTTMALWRFKSGAMCQLSHGVQLHGSKYESEIEVWADGLRMTLENPYAVCRLLVRRPNCGESNGDLVEVFEFKDDDSADPYFNEVRCFVEAIRSGDDSLVKSSYEDAYKTYELTWAIKRATEKNRNPQ
jgi:predicted dehydrogenase